MAIYLEQANLLFLHVPKTGGLAVTKYLITHVTGQTKVECGARHSRLTEAGLVQTRHPRIVSFFRRPADWVESYFNMKIRDAETRHGGKWFIYEPNTPFHPTWELDMNCQAFEINEFAEKLMTWNSDFFRTMYGAWYHADFNYHNLVWELDRVLDAHCVRYDRHALHNLERVNDAAEKPHRLTAETAARVDALGSVWRDRLERDLKYCSPPTKADVRRGYGL